MEVELCLSMSGKMWAGVHGSQFQSSCVLVCLVRCGLGYMEVELVCLVRCGLEYMEVELCLSMSGKMWAGVHGSRAVS